MFGLLDPERDVLARARIGREHRDDTADWHALDPTDQLEQRAGAEAASRVDLLVDRDSGWQVYACSSLRCEGTHLDRSDEEGDLGLFGPLNEGGHAGHLLHHILQLFEGVLK